MTLTLTPPRRADPLRHLPGVDWRVGVNPRQARELLTTVTYVGRTWRVRHLRALFACMYFAGLRPGEVTALRKDSCYLPRDRLGQGLYCFCK